MTAATESPLPPRTGGTDVPGSGEGDEPGLCANCGAALSGPFCAACGQEARQLSRPFTALVREAVDTIFSLDGRVARTLALLLFRPGALTACHLAGRRARFVPPVRLLLTTVVFFFLVLEMTGVALVQFHTRPGARDGIIAIGSRGGEVAVDLVLLQPPAAVSQEQIAAVIRPIAEGLPEAGGDDGRERMLSHARALLAGLQDAIARPAALNGFLRDWVPRLLFLLIPVFAGLAKMAWRDRHYHDHLIFALHLHAFAFILAAIFALASLAWPSPWIGRLLMAGLGGYALLAMKRVHDGGWVRTLVR
ncbi:MAG: DUF3667 domain-containing protein, partial [Alphaproteobacteria bacterium]